MKIFNLKKLISLCICIALIITALPLNFCITASALTEGIYTYTVSGGEATITDCKTSASGSITIPSTLGGYPVTSIGNNAFRRCDLLTSITIPDGVTSIGDWAFNNCTSLTSITIPDSVISIGNNAFSNCTSLISITIPDSVTSISNYAFSNCTSLISINVDVYNTAYISVNGVLFNKDKTALICCPASKKDTAYTVPDGVISIGNFAFERCALLVNITIPNSVTSIGGGAFNYCTLLTSINVDVDNTAYTSVNGVLFNKDKTAIICYPTGKRDTSYTIPDSVTNIGYEAFNSCTSLISVTIPDSVTSIDVATFLTCSSLTSVTIGAGVKSINEYAFYGCENLWHVLYKGTVENWNSIKIESCNSDLINAIRHYGALGDEVTTKTTEPTCTKQGYTRSFCSICDSEKTSNYITANGHNYEKVEIIEPTCTEQGYTIYNCSVCGEEFISDYLPAEHSYEIMKVVEPTCDKQGYTLYCCKVCYQQSSSDYTDMVPHSFVDGICDGCGLLKADLIESEHNYANNCNEIWTISKPDAESISITFSADTKTESGWDYIYIYDMNDNLIGKYSGTKLASQTITVQGDTVKIKLTSDSSNTYYGFAITNIQVKYVVDIDGDGVLNAEDLSAMQKAILGVIEVDEDNPGAYDLTKDGVFDLRDLLRLKLIMAGMVTG